MSKKNTKDDLRLQFRPKLFVQNIHQLESYDPNYEYKHVIFTYRHDPGRVQRYLEAGWEIVETTETTVDDRSFTPNSKDEKLRPQPMITNTKDGHQQVLLRCTKDRRQENELRKKEENDRLSEANTKRKGGEVIRRGNEIITKDAEINENNI